MLDLRGRLAVVIGGGAVAEQKLSGLRESGARVRVVAPRVTPAIESLASEGLIDWVRREYETGDLAGARLAIAATEKSDVHARVYHEAEERGVLLNAVDEVDRCHFIAPSVHRRGDVIVAVSTGGRCPALAVRLRERFARIVGPQHAELARIAGALRSEVARRIPPLAVRRAMWYRIVDSTALESLRQGDSAAAARVVETIIQEHEQPPRVSTNARVGTVALVGAGPGDPTLITVRGLELLERADVVVHDRLVSPDLVACASPRARVFSVGKEGHGASTSQDAINALLLREARHGRAVVRLKGGDPFVFGRGGEELAFLRRAGIPVEVVPGVSSAIAAPGAAGIPLTHRALSSGFVVITGHDSGGAPQLDWSAIARIPTVIVLMALHSLATVAAKLVGAGVAADVPAAVISRATLPDAQLVTGTLADIAELCAAAKLQQPATLVVGEVVRALVGEAAPGAMRGARAPSRQP